MTDFTRDDLPSDPATWELHRKKVLTAMTRIDGPFRTLTKEGWLDCPDGWLALDSEGDPYPVAATIYDTNYEQA